MKFAKGLPSVVTIRRWMAHIECEPGLISHSLDVLARKVQRAEQEGKKIYANLMFDEVAIKKSQEFDGKRFYGKVDLGPHHIPSNPEDAAKEALVFMLVGVNGHWKLPIAYYLISGLNTTERVAILKENVEAVEKSGVDLISVICDGLPANLGMASALGCKFDTSNLQTSFIHPGNPAKKIFFVLDICHCLKLVRGTFGTRDLTDRTGGTISWRFLEELDHIQSKEGLRAGNKLRKRHLNWERLKMNVRWIIISDILLD